MDIDPTPRTLTHGHLPDCLALARDRGWATEERKWAFLLDNGTGYGFFDDSGALVGSTIVTRYSGQHAALSMVLVASAHAGRGLGRRLVEHALANADCPVVSLHATALGRPLYEKLGFRAVDRLVTHFGPFRDAALSGTTRSALHADLPRVVATDAEVFGADRGVLWKDYFRLADQVRIGPSGGFAAAWRTVGSLALGPVVADSVDEAKALVTDLAAGAEGALQVSAYHPELADWLVERGLERRSGVDLMVLGGDVGGDRTRLYVPMMQALG
ncbi:GNAT family N-acetyltransferase [Umezawaea sp. Da 62-37]|uniref:GNAT family N-acetyltransferase n=1 Tax=Umezawaea sp. Da 62-37 TaxID=3075927 RepID=UPI0028F6CEE7|nr:GNAT family N-acetyltransferase [Umezawaea sp. Da 62-37]WNV83362.1 GNAT family N-acetyltransferase [Umezawaea sp. Da 62-37]